MEGFNLAELQAEFDQEDDESITQALRMAAESALAHTSGGGAGRRIRTASPVGATSSGPAATAGDGGWGGSAVAAPPQGGRGGGGRGGPTSPAEDELDALRRLEAEGGGVEFGNPAAWGGRPDPIGGGGGGGGEARVRDDGDWTSLSAKAVGRKRVADLKEYLDEEGVDYPVKARKAELVDMVLGLLAEG